MEPQLIDRFDQTDASSQRNDMESGREASRHRRELQDDLKAVDTTLIQRTISNLC